MKRIKLPLVITTIIVVLLILNAEAQITNGLHYTRGGKNYWYGADTSVTGAPAPGFESLPTSPSTIRMLPATAVMALPTLTELLIRLPIPIPGQVVWIAIRFPIIPLSARHSAWAVIVDKRPKLPLWVERVIPMSIAPPPLH